MAGIPAMCNLLVFALANNVHPDPSLQWTKFARGYVVDVREDNEEMHYYAGDPGVFRIISMPGVPASQMQSLAMGDAVPLTANPYRLRVNSINLDILEAGQQLGLHDVLAVTSVAVLATRTVNPVPNASLANLL